MMRIMKKACCLLLVCALTALTPVSFTATAEGLLGAMLDIALKAGKTIEGTLRIEAGGLLSAFSTDAESAEALAAIGGLLDSALLRVRYAQVEEQHVVAMALELQGKEILSLDVWTSDEEIRLESSLLPGKTLVIPAELAAQSITPQISDMMDGALADALAGATERYGAVVNAWAAQNGNIVSIQEEPIPATRTRDAALYSMTLRVTDAQWQALLRGLVDEFAEDTALQQALASLMDGTEPADLAALAQQWADSFGAAQGDVVEATVFLGEEDQLIGLEVSIEPSSSLSTDVPAPLEGSFTYGHQSMDEEHTADSYTASFTWEEDSSLQAQFSRQDKIPNQFLPGQGEKYSGRARLATPETGALELEVAGDITETVDPIEETYNHTFDLMISQAVEGVDAGDLAALLQAPLLSAGFTLSSKTAVTNPENFHSEGAFTLRFGDPLATIHYTLKSSANTPAAHPENTILRLDTLTSDEMTALTLELTENMQTALLSAFFMSGEEPALNAYTLDNESVPSIDSVVGFRDITNSEAGITEGKPYVMVFYKTSDALADLSAYTEVISGNGWALTKLEGDTSGGTIQMATESAVEGSLLVMTIEFTPDSYSVLLHRTMAALTRTTDDDGNELGEITLTK